LIVGNQSRLQRARPVVKWPSSRPFGPNERRLKETTRSALRDALRTCYSDFKERLSIAGGILASPPRRVKSFFVFFLPHHSTCGTSSRFPVQPGVGSRSLLPLGRRLAGHWP